MFSALQTWGKLETANQNLVPGFFLHKDVYTVLWKEMVQGGTGDVLALLIPAWLMAVQGNLESQGCPGVALV